MNGATVAGLSLRELTFRTVFGCDNAKLLSQAIAHGNPIVLFTPYPNKTGWVVQAVHQVSPACRSLPHAP